MSILANNEYPLSIIPYTSTELIKGDLGVTNRLGIEIKDSIIEPIVNGEKITQAEDGNLPNAGGSYLMIFISRGYSAKIQFDNLTVQEVK